MIKIADNNESQLIVNHLVEMLRGNTVGMAKERLMELMNMGELYQGEFDAVIAELQRINTTIDNVVGRPKPEMDKSDQPPLNEEANVNGEEGQGALGEPEEKPAEEFSNEGISDDVAADGDLSLTEERAIFLAYKDGKYPVENAAKDSIDRLTSLGYLKNDGGALTLSQKGNNYAKNHMPTDKKSSKKIAAKDHIRTEYEEPQIKL